MTTIDPCLGQRKALSGRKAGSPRARPASQGRFRFCMRGHETLIQVGRLNITPRALGDAFAARTILDETGPPCAKRRLDEELGITGFD